jgi:hypothetical protein
MLLLGRGGRRASTALQVFEPSLELLAVITLKFKSVTSFLVTRGRTYLRDSVLYPTSLSQIGDLGPVLVRVGRGTEGRAGGVCRGISGVASHWV